MKTVLSGAALAAILALASPAWAQAPAGPQPAPAPAGGNESPTAAQPAEKTQATKPHATRAGHAQATEHKRMKHASTRQHTKGRHAAKTHPMHRTSSARARSTPTDNIANQLNRQEAQRLSGGSMAPGGPPMQQPGYQGQ